MLYLARGTKPNNGFIYIGLYHSAAQRSTAQHQQIVEHHELKFIWFGGQLQSFHVNVLCVRIRT